MKKPRTFRLWAQGDAHVGRDLEIGRESLADALGQSEQGGAEGGPPFGWDVAINVGDYSGEHGTPKDLEGEEVVRQFSVLKEHRREQIYSVSGNHDRNGLDEPEAAWFRKWIDPMGENTAFSCVDRARYPFPVVGEWMRYKFEVGNIVFLMMSDINEPSQKVGRGKLGGNPGGVVSQETFDWWKEQVDANRDRIVITVHHYVLKNTTFASDEWGGMKKDAHGNWEREYHRYFEEGTPAGASFLCWVGGAYDSSQFEAFLEDHPGSVDLWLGGHTHSSPDDTKGGRSCVERAYGGTTFMNVCALTRHMVHERTQPHSWLLTFTEGSRSVRAQCYMHTSEFQPQGWYDAAERTIELTRPFAFQDS